MENVSLLMIDFSTRTFKQKEIKVHYVKEIAVRNLKKSSSKFFQEAQKPIIFFSFLFHLLTWLDAGRVKELA